MEDLGEGPVYYPGTITGINYDGTFAVDYDYVDGDGNGKERKHRDHVFPKDLMVRERNGWDGVRTCVWLFPSVVVDEFVV